MKKIIFYNLLIFSFIYFIFEILTGTLIFNKIDCHYLLCNKNFTFKNEFGFYDNKINKYKRDEFGFRGKRKKISDIDILTIGGSTTDERYLNLEDTWSEKLEFLFNKNEIDVDIVNAGIDGQSTIGHIWNFQNWFPKLNNFQTKYIIFYIGLNERLISEQISKYDNNFNLKDSNLKNKIIFYLKKNNGLTYRLYQLIYKKFFYYEKIPTSHVVRKPEYKKIKKKFKLQDWQKDKLKKNLFILTKYTKEMNAIPIFVSQKSLRGIIVNGETYSNNNFDIFNYEKQISQIIQEYCNDNAEIFIDLFNEIKFENNDFYDLIHTTPKGSEKISNYLFAKLNNIIKF